MTRFEEWWEKDFLESGIYSEKYWLGERDAAKRAWNAALEEAAKMAYVFLADECPDNDYDSGFNDAANRIGDTIRSLKEE